MRKVDVEGVDVSHARLLELVKLADQARPFYEWVERKFQSTLDSRQSLERILITATKVEIETGLFACYRAAGEPDLPLLFDGVGRSYPHQTACYYFFSWMVRDAPKQRLEPLIQRIRRVSRRDRVEIEVDTIASLIDRYRDNLKTFSWEAIREVVLDRLEGSRRSIKGHEREAIVRIALLAAVQSYYLRHSNYGMYARVELDNKQFKIGRETFDVNVRLLDDQGNCKCRILVPVKTRETEGGGHAHLFTRDIRSAVDAVRSSNPDDFVVAVIVARSWSSTEADIVRREFDHVAVFDLSPNEFTEFGELEQQRLNEFVSGVLSGSIRRGSFGS